MAVHVSRILHAGYLFQHEGVTLAFDPIFESPFSSNCQAFPTIEFDESCIRSLHFDAVFISHFHDDHCSLESLDFIARDTPIYLYCLHPEMFEMIRALGFKTVTPLRGGDSVELGTFRVTPQPALDHDVDCIFEIEAGAVKVLNVVDSWIDPETLRRLARRAPWDLVLWPFQTMREIEVLAPSRQPALPAEIPAEWGPHWRALQPRCLVPSSCQFQFENWSWYNDVFFPISYAMFSREVLKIVPATRVLRLDPGDSIVVHGEQIDRAPRLPWVTRKTEVDVDYEFSSQRVPPSTASIAMQFRALSPSQETRVLEFCRLELIDRFSQLEQAEDSYFVKPRVWKLSILDHRGLATSFFFRVEGAQLVPIEDSNSPPNSSLGWSTEIPAARLWAALEEGEQLTSLYLRVNFERLSDQSEAEMASELVNCGPLDDPLVRCLYTNRFGAYQSAQLYKLINHKKEYGPTASY